MERGKYQSLTMVNWNGFFARTFDIDNLVTTLSGGNGAGKSTTMAAFITTLIPDQSLLHFRNTTEAGSSNASRDKGLHGKLKPGACYAALDVVNSKQQRIIFAVRLQQVAGRDKKVDIKPFLIQGLPADVKPTEVLIETLSDSQARVYQLNDVKEIVSKYDGAQFKTFNSVTDYHSQMFELGVLPKKLRNSQDRGKFYRLIEASLYGGISSAITRSLRDYLLPHNSGVKKAFQDMEAALRENRMTLEAIKLTQRDRDLFKHLISEATNYVAADYMRHANERQQKLDQTLRLRGDVMRSRQTLLDQQSSLINMNAELKELTQQESVLEQDHQSASDHLQLVQTAVRQAEKIARYKEDLEELTERLEEQVMIVEEAAEQLAMAEEQSQLTEEEVDSLKTQLADYQQALDMQQTRALQYQQAVQALDKARELSGDHQMLPDQAVPYLAQLKQQQETQTTALLALKHKLDMSSAAAQQFEKGLAIVTTIAGVVDRANASEKAQELIAHGRQLRSVVERGEQLKAQYRDLERSVRSQRQALELAQTYAKKFTITIDSEVALVEEQARHEATLESLEQDQTILVEQRNDMRHNEQRLTSRISELEATAPVWIAASEALETLASQANTELDSSQAVMDAMQATLDQERQVSSKRDALAEQKKTLEQNIEHLAQPGGSDNLSLRTIAEVLGGTMLSEIYDDITLADAPYFSAMYGPARHAIVVPNLNNIKDKLATLENCPEDLYLIEGDADSFDDSGFNADELDGAVCVHLNKHQLRYSRLPKVPLFGRAAREQRLEALRDERAQLIEEHAKAAFDSQKLQRLYQSFNSFVANHMTIAFNVDPEIELKQARDERNHIQRQLAESKAKEQQQRSQLALAREGLHLLGKLNPVITLLEDDTLIARFTDVEQQLAQMDEARNYLDRHGKALIKLESLVSALDADPEQFDNLQVNYETADQQLQDLKTLIFAVADLVERRHYFSYADSVELLSKSSELNEQLKRKLVTAEQERKRTRDLVKQSRAQANQYNQLMASLKSSHQAKKETVIEFERELRELGVRADIEGEERARLRRDELHQRLYSSRQRRSQLEKSTTAIELEMKGLAKRLRKVIKDYQDIRKLVVNAKAGWCAVLRLARESDVERRLHRREMAYMSAEELRSLSDKALGALRLAVADNENLRDALRASEDVARPERKVLFYIAVYQHLRERIRHDIIRTDDPVEAIEEMEVELGRLTEELTAREQRLAISSDSVANIICKTIQREQNRIRMLNQGLQNIGFGQVNGVRLNVKVRDTHESLLLGLIEQKDQHNDLFANERLSFSEAIAKLFQRLNPHIDMGQRSPQILGEELLDYRNYLELSIEVNRGTDGWLQAESGALSTGEAIGTGQAILLMVVQSWEEESRRLRGKDIIPCRLLFLDEAARLDGKSIATLFELCERLDMQLLIAAPENISPEKGTTYKLVRKIFKDREHVHVVGLRGFGTPSKPKAIAPVQTMLDIDPA